MTENGTVFKTEATYAIVRFDRKSACDKCGMCSVSKDARRVEVRVKNSLNAKAGDNVSVQMGDRAVLISSFIVYIVPVIIVALALVFTSGMKWYASFGIAIGGAVASLFIITFADRYLRKKKGYLPTMTAIIAEEKNAETETQTEVRDERN